MIKEAMRRQTAKLRVGHIAASVTSLYVTTYNYCMIPQNLQYRELASGTWSLFAGS